MARRPQTTATNQHNSKQHENGTVGASGKRLQKQKSNGQLNGSAKSTGKIPSIPPLPATPPLSNGHARPQTETNDCRESSEFLCSAPLNGYSESSSSESYSNATRMSVHVEPHRQIDVNATKNPAVHRDAGPLSFLVTVLRSCPLYDTIAILIVLLQIPPTFLSIIHLLFATLTFVPPSTNSHSSFSFTDIFEGSLGTPSVATLVAVDLFVLLVWLFLWNPLQDIALDLAQTVIALTLGGGTAGKDAGFNNVLVCLGIIGVSHFAHTGSLKQSSLRMLLPSTGILGADSDDPLEPSPPPSNKGPHGWIRTILAIHILTQGVVRYIRDWYVRREKRDSMISAMGDPEAAKGSLPQVENTANESNIHTTNVPISDLDNLHSLPISNMSDKALNPKKKRKASAMVRIRQPLWSALASTKIVMAKEYETSRTAAESAGTNATDVNNLGNAPFNTEADRIWITYVGFDEVCFNTSYFPTHLSVNSVEPKDSSVEIPGIDRSKPFFVRVNKSVWQPTRINAITDLESQSRSELRWGGEIFGLAPMSNYNCDFVSTIDGSVLFSTSVRTMQAPTSDTAPTPMSSSMQRSTRPDSPTTTLKTSIATAEAKLNEERSRLKRERKEQKSKTNSARKEIDRLTTNIASSGGNDDRLRQKVQQSNLHAKQAEEAVATLVTQLATLDNLPEEESSEWKAAKSNWQTQVDIHKVAREDFHEDKLAAERDLQALSAEVTSYQQKKERMQSRINKLNGEHERITDANARGLDEVQRKATERAAKQADRARMEMLYMERLDTMGPQINEMQQSLTTIWANINSIQQAEFLASQAHTQSPTTSMPQINPYDIPEGAVSNAYPWNPPNFAPSYGSALAYGPPGLRTRGRSSSMLSNVSGFTQSSDEEPQMYLQPVDADQREHQSSEGGSSSTSGTSGSVGDPKSPLPVISMTSGGAAVWTPPPPWDES